MICRLCPRNCAALRTETQGAGLCRMPEGPVVARAALHMWEEPPISGSQGSGTIFFSGCSLGCVFCQNHLPSEQGFKTWENQNVRLHRRFSQKGPGHPPDAHSSRRVGTGGTYHNWSKDLKNIQHERSSFVTFL